MSSVEPRVAAGTLTGRIAALFENGGPLARALPEYEARPAQLAMADAVAGVFERGGVQLVEAGTGTGKTLAYLAPAILSGTRTLVSTGTKNLQEQIVEKDLPVLQTALGRPFTATVMKGRGNYLCLHRFGQLRAGGVPRQASLEGLTGDGELTERILLPILERWAATTATGDRAELADLPDDLPLWHEISASAENCLGTECPQFHDCFVTRMRQRAAESDLVIVNHHLLFADAAVRQSAYGEVIPQCEQAVLDEAHQLEDVATQYFGIAVSNYRLDELVRDAGRLIDAWPDESRRADLRRGLSRVEERAATFLAMLQPLRSRGDERVRVTAEALADVQDSGIALQSSLEALETAIQLLGDLPTPEAASVSIGMLDDMRAIAARMGNLRSDLRMLLRADDPAYVFFLETRGRGLFLRAAPIDVSGIMRDQVLQRFRAAVLTSATLTVDGRFDYVRGRLGVGGAGELRLSSEFDYTRQTILYLPRRMPPPRSPEFAAAVAREAIGILQRTEGRAFVLFTSYAVLRAVEPELRVALRYPLLVQGTAPRSALLATFRSTPHAVLLATSSFWQGVDVAGEALSCVIIDKLPFASPGDPITAARMEAVAALGGDPFEEYQVPLAILTLLQGLGRLIRHRQDRGVLAVLDPRLRTMGYGRRFLESLPPAPVTHDLDAIARFFAG